ncbi:hypothetical protein SAMN05518672_103409 [Chitinophaga sp. CF118]|uniref:hypothetical protein n=1 Tax=Chitinophaga sp. CF118 TaxID=1884367 RepID=UPI0008E7B877|nr:hypothetical protein [Chitinophaga sp. CF118]SFD83151.1 hypothetical protein SAMN05518672_103409 [Chitinophaga sp. CF118]
MRSNIFFQPYMIANMIAMIMILIAITKPVFGRVLLSFIFMAAAFINAVIVFSHPEVYRTYASMTALISYENFINGSFSDHTVAYVLAIAAGQLLVGLGLAKGGVSEIFALLGAIIFFLAIAPLGAGASFPCTIVLAIACMFMMKKRKEGPLFNLLIKPGIFKRIKFQDLERT